MHEDMTDGELKDRFNRLTTEAEKLMEANDDLEASFIAELEAKLDTSEAVVLTEQQKVDLVKTASECELKLKAIKTLARETLWANFGSAELSTALQAAEAECEHVAVIKPDGNYEVYDFVVGHLKELVGVAKERYSKWKHWIPSSVRRDLQSNLQKLELCIPRLFSRKADFLEMRIKEDADHLTSLPLKPTALPKFLGNKRDFHRWKKEWEALQGQAEPSGSKEIKKFQLLDNDIFRVLENRFGNQTSIAIEIVEELPRMPAVKSHQPRKIVELIQAVEKALQDLVDLGDTGAIKNPLVTKSIESKLPETLKKEWLIYVADSRNTVTPEKRFDSLLEFLKEQETIYEQLDHLREEEPSKRERVELKHSRTKFTKLGSDEGCVVCGDGKHKKKLYFCRQFKTLKLAEKKAAIKKLGACWSCLEVHDNGSYCKPTYLCKSPGCKEAHAAEHHYYLCPNAEVRKGSAAGRQNRSDPEGGKVSRKCTEDQEEFLRKLSPELARECRDAFSNTASRACSTTKEQPSLLFEGGLRELPVIMMLLEVTANAGQKIGTLIDLASDTNYITHRAASSLNLRSEEITLVVHGVGGMKTHVKTRWYLLKIRVRTPRGTLRSHQLVCYAEVHKHVTPSQLQRFFPDIPLDNLVRPKDIHLLISQKEGRLAPQRSRVIGDLVLWDGPLGKTVGGTHPELFEELTASDQSSTRKHVPAKLQRSSTSTTSQEFLEWWKLDSIGAACEPKCGGCRCGNCQPGGKEMTLAEERELEIIREGLTYVTGDGHSGEPHWHAKYPWVEDPASLPDNKRGVESTFLRTEKQLAKEPEWKGAYAAQVHDMVERGAAVKLSKGMISNWDGPVWYVSHLIAPNPHSVTTPVRLVWNSSQRFRGVSLNDLLIKGPDVLNQIRAVFLRFRGGVYGALGDIKKMYNSVWLEDREMHLHRFLWRDSEDDKLEEYAITRVNIGDKPAGCIAQLAMRETASLSTFSHLKEERQVLQQDSYVDDILTSHNDMNQLEVITENTGRILKAGGFELKPWVLSGQSGRRKRDDKGEKTRMKTIVLPNQMRDEENKALGLGYIVEEDKLHVIVAINFSKRKKKMRVGQDLVQEQIKTHTPNPLTRRELLSQVSGLYDPVGLVTPAKQKGAILVRRAFQETKVESCLVKDTWDMALSDALREDAIRLFEEYAQLSKVTFVRALTPPCFTEEPWAITFSDGSEQAYGAVLYLRWNSDQGTTIRLVESKAKLTPLDHKGDVVKAELCGAVFGSCLKKYFEAFSRIQVERWYHFVDSQTVIGAIQRESYGYQTFFTNRIGEIQSSTRIQDWWWIPGPQNIADVVTREASPRDLDEDSEWQNGPRFLSLPVSEWPVRSAKELAATAKENVNKLQRKAFVAALTRAKIRGQEEKQSFLMAYQRFTAIRGHPRKIWSDPGTNFIGAKSVLKELYGFLESQNKFVLEETAAKNGTEWMWKVNPADSPHRNGAAEAAVRIVKRALQSLGRESGLSYSEFQTALHVAANLANERPIDARVQSREGCIHYVTPNTLLLGRASQNGDFKMFDFSVYPYKRLQAIQAEVSKFWRSWSQLAGPNLFVRSKWHTAHRNVAVGDVVWLSDQNALRGHFKMGIVVSTNPDKKGIVRDVNVRVCSSYSGSVAKSLRAEDLSSGSKGATPVAQATILHRDVRRLVVLLPVEEQNGTKSSASCFNGMS
ncbi:GTP-binding protein [Sarotherodon galilaeus]